MEKSGIITCSLIAVENYDKVLLLDFTIAVPVKWQTLGSFFIKYQSSIIGPGNNGIIVSLLDKVYCNQVRKVL